MAIKTTHIKGFLMDLNLTSIAPIKKTKANK